jgi:hypothetical protein
MVVQNTIEMYYLDTCTLKYDREENNVDRVLDDLV